MDRFFRRPKPAIWQTQTVAGVEFPMTNAIPQHEDLVYAGLSPAQKLDLYLPKGNGPFPLVILVHGGGFNMGDKSHMRSKPGTDDLLQNGFAVANVNYRLSEEAKSPAQIQDVKTAVRWLRAHAQEYNLDLAKFGTWGSSAGANIAVLLGTSAGVAALEGAEMGCKEYSSAVQAVVDWFGPIDFLRMDEQFAGKSHLQTHNAPDSPESILIGAPIQTRPHQVEIVNPLTYVTPNAPPFLIQHGTKDDLVPVEQSKMLYNALKAAIGPDKVTLTLLNGASHGGGPQFWDPANVKLVINFLERYLKNEPRKIEKIYQEITTICMTDGPSMYSYRDGLFIYGGYKNLTFTEKEHGKTARVEVNSRNQPICWIELWHGHYNNNWDKWSAERGAAPIAQSSSGQPQANPSLEWIIEPGDYMLYFVASSKDKDVKNEIITFQIKTD
jgi:acetyl esterase/lipase